MLKRWVRAPGPAGGRSTRSCARDFGAFEDAIATLAERGFVLRGARAERRSMAEPFTHRLRVRYAECDVQGVVFNSHYLAYFDIAITELWRAALGGYEAMLDRGLDIVVAEAHLRSTARRGSTRS